MASISLSRHREEHYLWEQPAALKKKNVPVLTRGKRLHDLHFKINVKEGLFLHQGYLHTVAIALIDRHTECQN